MSLRSMTGFGRADGGYEDWSWVWEVRAVNGKSLDIRMKLPNGYESLEPHIRKHVATAVHRGNLQIGLTVQTTGADTHYRLNTGWLHTLANSVFALGEERGINPARLDGLYAVKGVVEEIVPSAADPKYSRRNIRMLKSLGEMTRSLNKARASEGKDLAKVLVANIKAMARQVGEARKCAAGQAETIKQKFDQRFEELLGEKLPPDRLAQEAAILAVKADIREELDRLATHIQQALSLTKKGSPVGRKLDFLSQEILREINTLCAKSTNIELTHIGLEMKSLIEQFREQAANVE